jgi:hypothetical protein
MPEDALWPGTSDIDLFLLVDREMTEWSEQKKLLHNGVILEAVIFPIDRFPTPEQVLTRSGSQGLNKEF